MQILKCMLSVYIKKKRNRLLHVQHYVKEFRNIIDMNVNGWNSIFRCVLKSFTFISSELDVMDENVLIKFIIKSY